MSRRSLHLVLEIGVHAVTKRPVRPFGLPAQFVIARSFWLQQSEAGRHLDKLEHKLAGIQETQCARLTLTASAWLWKTWPPRSPTRTTS